MSYCLHNFIYILTVFCSSPTILFYCKLKDKLKCQHFQLPVLKKLFQPTHPLRKKKKNNTILVVAVFAEPGSMENVTGISVLPMQNSHGTLEEANANDMGKRACTSSEFRRWEHSFFPLSLLSFLLVWRHSLKSHPASKECGFYSASCRLVKSGCEKDILFSSYRGPGV